MPAYYDAVLASDARRQVVRTLARSACIAMLLGTLAGCAAGGDREARLQRLDWSRTRPFGLGAAFHPPPYGRRVRAGEPVGALRCRAASAHAYGVHLELFAADRVVRLPAGIGLASPERLDGGRVLSERCAYPIHTVEPTGVVEVAPGVAAAATVGALFELWGQPLDPRQLAGFAAGAGQPVVAFVDGRRWTGDPRLIPLRRHAQVVLEVGPLVSPHPSYRFAPGL
jgi:hypothetical protein